MLGPKHYPLIARFLDSVDAFVTSPMLDKLPPDEKELTRALCSGMDAQTQRRRKDLSFNVDMLNEQLCALGDGLAFEATFETHAHKSTYENLVSQSDLGLVINYTNRVLPDLDWSDAYLVQAKRVYGDRYSGSYSMKSQFLASDKNQHRAIAKLRTILGDSALLYGLYTPPLSLLDEVPRVQGRTLHLEALRNEIYDYAEGLAFKDWIASRSTRPDPGIWLTATSEAPTSLGRLHERAYSEALPFTWFFLRLFGQVGGAGMMGRVLRRSVLRDTSIGNDASSLVAEDLVRGIAVGESGAIEKLLDKLGEDAKPNFTFVPAHTITISVAVGDDVADAIRFERGRRTD